MSSLGNERVAVEAIKSGARDYPVNRLDVHDLEQAIISTLHCRRITVGRADAAVETNQ